MKYEDILKEKLFLYTMLNRKLYYYLGKLINFPCTVVNAVEKDLLSER